MTTKTNQIQTLTNILQQGYKKRQILKNISKAENPRKKPKHHTTARRFRKPTQDIPASHQSSDRQSRRFAPKTQHTTNIY